MHGCLSSVYVSVRQLVPLSVCLNDCLRICLHIFSPPACLPPCLCVGSPVGLTSCRWCNRRRRGCSRGSSRSSSRGSSSGRGSGRSSGRGSGCSSGCGCLCNTGSYTKKEEHLSGHHEKDVFVVASSMWTSCSFSIRYNLR